MLIKCRYLRFVKPSYDNFVSPTSRYADIVSVTSLKKKYGAFIF